ncbi:MAG: metal ABC transporter permease [Phycisphaeraceae bacterium]|nr:metal ABC transporter permease [Phycisphaeraceae bacterium]
MRTIDWLADPALRSLLLPGLLAGVAIFTAGSVLSVFVVLKRLSFVGQGVSHSAFGGIGIAAVLGLFAAHSPSTGVLTLAIVLAFCVISAVGMALVGDRRAVREDTAIGVFLVASMSLGAVLLAVASRHGRLPGAVAYESILFGQILGISAAEAWVAAGATSVAIVAIWWIRRPLLFWAFDESAAVASGVPGRRSRLVLMSLLALLIVIAMKLVGVILATAVLVLPGATALKLSRRLSRVIAVSIASSLVSLLLGVAVSLEADLPPGATIVLVMTGQFALAIGINALVGRAARGGRDELLSAGA